MENEHTSPDPSLPGAFYWHVQTLTLSEATLVAAVGISRRVGIEALVPVRHVVSRIRFLDADRLPLERPEGDIHHRDETLFGIADPWLTVNAGTPVGAWTIAGRAGVTLPLGRTEPDPFALGDAGLPHQHIQFGTGTWDPILGAAAGRRFGEAALTLSAVTRLVFGTNGHGYRAGHRFWAEAMVSRRLAGSWSGRLGLDVAREEPERWGGRVRIEEGNLGRTDLLAVAGVDHRMGGAGSLWLTARVPLVTDSEGAQVDYPVIFTVGWAF